MFSWFQNKSICQSNFPLSLSLSCHLNNIYKGYNQSRRHNIIQQCAHAIKALATKLNRRADTMRHEYELCMPYILVFKANASKEKTNLWKPIKTLQFIVICSLCERKYMREKNCIKTYESYDILRFLIDAPSY